MKKAISLILALLLCLSLFTACGSSSAKQWVAYDGTGFVLLSSGKFISHPTLEDAITSSSGYWEKDGNYIIRYYSGNGYDRAEVYKRINSNILLHDNVLYTKTASPETIIDINQKLQGTWHKSDIDLDVTYTFSDGSFAMLGERGGIYGITDSHLILYWDNGVIAKFPYTYRNEVLTIDGLYK